MLSFFAWYLVITLLGGLAFPLAFRLLPALADRGYSLARVLGLLIWGYLFWMLASLGFIQNDAGGLGLSLLLLVVLSAAATLRRVEGEGLHFDLRSVWEWVKGKRRMMITVEVLFFVAFAVWSFIQSTNPEITTAGGEKTMELAFINSIMRSPTFPPRDPWLSGYGISYYYFGYVMTAMLAEVTGVVGSVAHNLMLCLIFALSAAGAYGVLYDLLAAWRRKSGRAAKEAEKPRASIYTLPLLGPFFLLIVSNLEGFLEVLSSRGIFWKFNADGTASSPFWKWLDILQLNQPPTTPLKWMPDRFIWWWRASRIVQDHNLAGVSTEIIDEFPFFSYMLGDLHPHVLAMPFDLLAMAVALNLFLGGWKGITNLFGLRLPIAPQGFLFSGLVLGGLAFLNTWDILFGFGLVVGALLLVRAFEDGWRWKRLEEVLAFTIPVGVLAVLLYLPFYVGFSSQAGGILPNLDSPTRGAQLWVFWGELFLPVGAYLVYLWRGEGRPLNWKAGFGLAAGLILFLWLFSWLLGLIALWLFRSDAQAFLDANCSGNAMLCFSLATTRRLIYTGGWLTLLVLIGTALSFLLARKDDMPEAGQRSAEAGTPLALFILLLFVLAGVLILIPDFVFLRDLFNDRMNTIFKFYYQAWLMLSLGAAFGAAVLIQKLKDRQPSLWIGLISVAGAGLAIYLIASGSTLGFLSGFIVVLLLIAGQSWFNRQTLPGYFLRVGLGLILVLALTYPALALLTKTDDFKWPEFQQTLAAARAAKDPSPLAAAARVWTLDGAVGFDNQFPDDAAAVRWLQSAPVGVLVEATKQDASYTDYGHISAYSGMPAILGWPFHEYQWRGTYDVQGSRLSDIQQLYEARSWDQTQAILAQYGIRYVYVGTLEHQLFRVYEAKFQRYLRQAFHQNDVSIYEVP